MLKDRKELSILRTPAASYKAPDTVHRPHQRQPRRCAATRSSSITRKPSGPITRTPAPAANIPCVQQDKSLPKGWSKMKLEGGRTQLVSPQRVSYRDLQAALQAMVKNGNPDKEVEGMRILLHHEGWITHSKLPREQKSERRNTRGVKEDC